MRRIVLFAAAAVALLAAVSSDSRLTPGGPPVEVAVVNFPPVQQIAGEVTVGAPIPGTRFETLRALVSPAKPSEISDLTDAGVLDVTGFTFVTLSLAGNTQGKIPSAGAVGAMLIPEQTEILSILREQGVPEFPLFVEAKVIPSEAALFQSLQINQRLGFPRYRVFLYNTTPRTSQVVLYAYLNNA